MSATIRQALDGFLVADEGIELLGQPLKHWVARFLRHYRAADRTDGL